MYVVILAGGKGKRLVPYTTTIPKPLVPVGEKPILEIIINQLVKAGVLNVVIAVNHMAQLIQAFFGSGSQYGVSISYSVEDKPLSTVAPLKLIQDLPENFIVMNGDILTDIDYNDLYSTHVQAESLITIATFERETHIDYGVLDIYDGKVKDFHEKPNKKFSVSMGIYVLNKKILQYVPDGEEFGFDDLVYELLRKQVKINAYKHQGYWLDIGRPEDYQKANDDIKDVLNNRY